MLTRQQLENILVTAGWIKGAELFDLEVEQKFEQD